MPGLRTVSIDGEEWRILTVEVLDVPASGDLAIVDLVAPLGDVNNQARQLRRRSIVVGFLVAIGSGLIGIVLGRRAAAPLSALRNDAARIGASPQADWAVRPSYGAAEVDDVAGAVNTSLERLAEATERREAALTAARSFAAAASHELRTPLQAAMAELDLALASAPDQEHDPRRSIVSARSQLDRMASSLAAVRALTEVDLVDSTWFVEADLSDLADQAVAALSSSEASGVSISFAGDEASPCRVWPDGVTLAVENVIRNALRHARPADGRPLTVRVSIDAARTRIAIDDNGPGIPLAERERVVLPFERGTTASGGSGLGLAFAAGVVAAHGGRLSIGDGPLGGARVSLCFGPERTCSQPQCGRIGP